MSQAKVNIFLAPPIDVPLDDDNAFQADICYVAKGDRSCSKTKILSAAHPTIVVEVLSPGTWKNDRFDKKVICEKYAVKEYWIVDPVYKTVEILVLENNTYQLRTLAEGSGTLHSAVLDGFQTEMERIFENI